MSAPKPRKSPKPKLNLRQEKFCILYATDAEFFGNGVETYLEVYGANKKNPNWYQIACQEASRLLSTVKVIERINEIITETGFNDVHIDKQLSFLATQHADFSTKLGAIKEYNKLKQRITDKAETLLKGNLVIERRSYQDDGE